MTLLQARLRVHVKRIDFQYKLLKRFSLKQVCVHNSFWDSQDSLGEIGPVWGEVTFGHISTRYSTILPKFWLSSPQNVPVLPISLPKVNPGNSTCMWKNKNAGQQFKQCNHAGTLTTEREALVFIQDCETTNRGHIDGNLHAFLTPALTTNAGYMNHARKAQAPVETLEIRQSSHSYVPAVQPDTSLHKQVCKPWPLQGSIPGGPTHARQ